MKNITVTVDDDVHRRARIRAAERDTSVSAVVRGFLIHWSVEETEFERLKRLQNETLNEVDTFRAGDRLPRDDIVDPARGDTTIERRNRNGTVAGYADT